MCLGVVSSRAGLTYLALLVLAVGCDRSWESKVVQPRPYLGVSQEGRTSFPLVIRTRDMDLPRFIHLVNSAYFVVVSKDRMRFHVTLHHKWESMSDPSRWVVWIEDDLGRRFYPSSLDGKRVRPVNQVFGQRRYRGSRVLEAPLHLVEAVEEIDDRLPLAAFGYYRGDADFVFYREDLFRSEMRVLTLVMKRPGYEYRYVWTFVDDPDAPGATRPVAARVSLDTL